MIRLVHMRHTITYSLGEHIAETAGTCSLTLTT